MADIKRWTVTEPWLEPHCALGEGPLYEPATDTLRFVDIKKKQVLTVSMSEGAPSLTHVQLDQAVTVTSDIDGVDPQDRILIGVKYGIAVMDRKTGKYEMLKPFNDESNERLRSNEGAADPNGRFWLGTMTDFAVGAFKEEGEFFP
jgi:sugar lactone lactonase YvrE